MNTFQKITIDDVLSVIDFLENRTKQYSLACLERYDTEQVEELAALSWYGYSRKPYDYRLHVDQFSATGKTIAFDANYIRRGLERLILERQHCGLPQIKSK